MGATPVNNDGASNADFAEQIYDKGIKSVVVDEAQGLASSEEDELRTNGINGEIYNGSDGAIQVFAGPLKPQPQRAVVHWERFLPSGSLKVLLVENDNSTRHVVSALLRNCSYEVTAVANGLQAWKILQDLPTHIDLVLSEVVMPFLSGIGLLCKIMSHKTLKNTPIIMMSSHDSMGLVFKCLSKGAVDFLVKPIRKNELKNLWQHVWRRCHSSSGSWSESDAQTTKSVKSKSNDESENNTGSSDEHDDNGHIGIIQDGTDNGRGTQGSWMKGAAEVDNRQPLSTWDQLSNAPDSFSAIHRKPEKCSSSWMRGNGTKECLEQDEKIGERGSCKLLSKKRGIESSKESSKGSTTIIEEKVAMGKDLELGISRDPGSLLEYQDKFSTQPNSKRQIKLSELVGMAFEKERIDIQSENISSKLGDCGVNVNIARGSCTEVENRALDSLSGLDTTQIKDKSGRETREAVRTSVIDDRNVSRHPDLSAFSKYSAASSTNQAPTGNTGSCSPLVNSPVAMKTETILNSSQNDMALTTKYVSKPEALNDKSEPVLAFKCSQSSAFQSVQNDQFCQQKLVPGKNDDVAVKTDQVHTRVSSQQVQVQHHHHHYHHYHHHVHNTNDSTVQGLDEGKSGNYSVNGSPLGSNHGSNGQNGSSNALNARSTNVDSERGAGISERVGGNGTDEDRFAQREAALIKFRQKRKERCFEKKVRYQGRKRLAEQRPRIKGQFVRQTLPETKSDKQDNVAPEDVSCDSNQ